MDAGGHQDIVSRDLGVRSFGRHSSHVENEVAYVAEELVLVDIPLRTPARRRELTERASGLEVERLYPSGM